MPALGIVCFLLIFGAFGVLQNIQPIQYVLRLLLVVVLSAFLGFYSVSFYSTMGYVLKVEVAHTFVAGSETG